MHEVSGLAYGSSNTTVSGTLEVIGSVKIGNASDSGRKTHAGYGKVRHNPDAGLIWATAKAQLTPLQAAEKRLLAEEREFANIG